MFGTESLFEESEEDGDNDTGFKALSKADEEDYRLSVLVTSHDQCRSITYLVQRTHWAPFLLSPYHAIRYATPQYNIRSKVSEGRESDKIIFM